MDDLNFNQLQTVQSNLQPDPVTMASAANIEPTTKMTILTGATPVTTIVRPVSGYHELTFLCRAGTASHFATGGTGTATRGIIGVTVTSVTNRPIIFYYNPLDNTYYPMTVA